MKFKAIIIIFILSFLIASSARATNGVCICNGVCTEADGQNSAFCAALTCKDYTASFFPIADCATWQGNTAAVGAAIDKASNAAAQYLDKLGKEGDKLQYADLKKNAQKTLNPVGFTAGKEGVFQIMRKAINFFVGIAGMVSMILYIWAGFKWMSAAGNSESITQAQAIIAWTTIGIVVILSSYILVRFLFDTVLKIPA